MHLSSRPGAGPVCDLIPSISEVAGSRSACLTGGPLGSGSLVGVGSGGLEPSVSVAISDRGDGGALILWLIVFCNVVWSQTVVFREVYE